MSSKNVKEKESTATPDRRDPEAHEFRKVRLEKVEKLRALGVNPYPYTYEATATAADLQKKYAKLKDEDVTTDSVSAAGRIMSIRNSGMFIDLMDTTGNIQIFSHKQDLSPEQLEIVSLLDRGDLVGITGYVRRTPRGELTINAKEIMVLGKSLATLPVSYHGLEDVEARYRNRWVDLVMNEDSRATLRVRSKMVSAIRTFFEERDWLEVETPMLHPIPGGTSAKPFVTEHNALDQEMFLRIAPELYLKKLVVGGLSNKVFEINRNFRNEGISVKHNPEFTMIEGYQAYADYGDMMTLIEQMVEFVCTSVLGKTKVIFADKEIEMKGPWPRKTMAEMVQDETGIDFMAIESDIDAAKAARDLGVHVPKKASWGKAVEEVFSEKVEPTIVDPVHVIDYPKDISPLAKVHRENPRLAERFETFINGWEIANAFSELTDPVDQAARFEAQVEIRDAGDEEAMFFDQSYIDALEVGLPPTGGFGVGVDRLIMLLTDSQNIRDVILFPTLRRKD